MKQSALGEGKDRIDDAVDQEDDVDYMRTIYDVVNDRDVVLSDRDLEIRRRIQSGVFAHRSSRHVLTTSPSTHTRACERNTRCTRAPNRNGGLCRRNGSG